MDFELITNDENCQLKFRNVRRLSDDSGYKANLFVRSKYFLIDGHSFYFDRDSLKNFIDAVSLMDEMRECKASLTFRYDKDRVTLESKPSGKILVDGEVFEHGSEPQEVHFMFVTDQTCLKPLLQSLKNCWDMSVEAEQ